MAARFSCHLSLSCAPPRVNVEKVSLPFSRYNSYLENNYLKYKPIIKNVEEVNYQIQVISNQYLINDSNIILSNNLSRIENDALDLESLIISSPSIQIVGIEKVSEENLIYDNLESVSENELLLLNEQIMFAPEGTDSNDLGLISSPLINEKANDNDYEVTPVKLSVENNENFDNAFVLPTQYLPKKKRLKVESSSKPKPPAAMTSDRWLKDQLQKEEKKRVRDEKIAEKKCLMEEKKKIIAGKSKFLEKIKEIELKMLRENNIDERKNLQIEKKKVESEKKKVEEEVRKIQTKINDITIKMKEEKDENKPIKIKQEKNTTET